MRPRRIRYRDPQEQHAELASQLNRLSKAGNKSNRTDYLKAARRDMLADMLAQALPLILHQAQGALKISAEAFIERLVRHSKEADLADALKIFQSLKKEEALPQGWKERHRVALRKRKLAVRIQRLMRELGIEEKHTHTEVREA